MPIQANLIRRILYRLKRDFGTAVDLYDESGDTVDLTTGQRTVTKQVWNIARAICLPTAIHRNAIDGAALKPMFQYGETVQEGDKMLLIDRRDLPQGFTLGIENWYAVVQSRRYEIVQVQEYEDQAAYCVTLKELKGAPINQTVSMTVSHSVGVTDTP